MAKQLTATIQSQIDTRRINKVCIFKINGVDRTAYLLDYNFSYDIKFGAAAAEFTLVNAGGVFGEDGLYKLHVGDVVELIEKYEDDSTEFKKFYGLIEQRSINKSFNERSATISCLDYITVLQKTDINADIEGTKVRIEEEILTPNYLSAPNDSLAQVFDFANNAIAQDPPPTLVIRPKSGVNLVEESPQFDGFTIKYQEGQVLLGTPLNARDNYNLVATVYYFYTEGVYFEDILETLIKTEDGYGKHIFGETSEADVVTNHLQDTFLNVEGRLIDYCTPNYQSSEITIKTQMAQAYDPDGSGDPTILYVDSTEGFPDSGSGSINGDLFTWTGRTGTTLTGISGLKAHPIDSFVQYTETYAAGQVWYLSYSNIQSTISPSDFTNLPSAAAIRYIDYRFGRIILYDAISLSTILTHTTDYTFKTLQASGIQINRIRFHPREFDTRFDAINKLRDFVAPNFIIRTIGDNKIWANYLYQKVNEDYNLELIESLNYLEDEDIYTRVVFYGKNNNPTNIMLREGVEFTDAGVTYKATAIQDELQYERDDGNFWVYKTVITDAGHIDVSILPPTVFINNVPVNNQNQVIPQVPVQITVTQRTETVVRQRTSRPPTVEVHQYFYYQLRLPHTSILSSQPIYFHDAFGTTVLTISPNDGNMDYGSGIYHVPGTSQNSVVESVSTATYTVFYSTSLIDIDYETIRFKISKQLVPIRDGIVVAATFQYWTAVTAFSDIGSVIDGRLDSQVQTEFFAEPPTGLNYAILDLGQIYNIQAIDFLGGFYRPDNIRKFDIDFRFTLHYSLDNIDYFAIGDKTTNVQLTGGSSVSFEEDQLGVDFRARYLKLILEDVKKIPFGTTTNPDGTESHEKWVVAITEISAYDDIVLKSEAKLIPTTYLAETINIDSAASSGTYPTSITVEDSSAFEIPESGQTATAYIEEDVFTYTGIESGNVLVGVQGISQDHAIGAIVTQQLSDDVTIYDYNGLLPKLGDRLYKVVKIDNNILYSQAQLDNLSKAFLAEFYKNHSKLTANVVYSPYLLIGQTVKVTDTYNNIDVNYFIESLSYRGNIVNLVLARYPNDGSTT